MKRILIAFLISVTLFAGGQKKKADYRVDEYDHLTVEEFTGMTEGLICWVEFYARWNQDGALDFLHEIDDFDYVVYRVDVDLEPGLTYKFEVFSVPTLLYLVDGVEYYRIEGGVDFELSHDPEELMELMDAVHYQFIESLEGGP